MFSELSIYSIIFLYGLCIGSFLNVCIFRVPVSLSIVRPGSACPICKKAIKWYDNFPVFSFLLLKGQCRNCKTKISLRYPLIELFTGIMWLFTYLKFGISLEFIIYVTFISTLIVITFIDLDHQIIPDVISLPGIPVFFAASLFISAPSLSDALIKSTIGVLAGGGSLFLVAWLYELITKNEGIGGGDIKLLAMIGGLLGLKGVLFTIFAASAIGTLIGVCIMVATRNNMRLAIPFGPFLSAGAILYLFFGKEVIHWYLNYSGLIY